MQDDKHLQLNARAKTFALRVIRMCQALPKSREANVIAQQILRSATSVAANYRAAGRSRSRAEFIAKIGVVLEEADETALWLELLSESGIISAIKLKDLLNEANQLTAIFSASRRTVKSGHREYREQQGSS
jgi:four helix bundle protein